MKRFWDATMVKMKQQGSKDENHSKAPQGRTGPAFLLAQLGAHAASKFAEHLAELELMPAHAGIFRILAASPAITQQALAIAALPGVLLRGGPAFIDRSTDGGLTWS